jgi:hypothetical protein
VPVEPFTFTVCGFFNFNCIRQQGTAQRVDAVSEWPMHRFPYRNFGTHQTLVGTFTVGGGLGEEGASIRWFELRHSGDIRGHGLEIGTTETIRKYGGPADSLVLRGSALLPGRDQVVMT